MAVLLILLLLTALVAYGLERNHRRHGARHHPIGGTDVEDRDAARAWAETAAIFARWPSADPKYRVVRRRRTRHHGRVPAQRSAPEGRSSHRPMSSHATP